MPVTLYYVLLRCRCLQGETKQARSKCVLLNNCACTTSSPVRLNLSVDLLAKIYNIFLSRPNKKNNFPQLISRLARPALPKQATAVPPRLQARKPVCSTFASASHRTPQSLPLLFPHGLTSRANSPPRRRSHLNSQLKWGFPLASSFFSSFALSRRFSPTAARWLTTPSSRFAASYRSIVVGRGKGM